MRRGIWVGLIGLAVVAVLLVAAMRPSPDDAAGRAGDTGVPADETMLAERRGALVDQIVVTQETDAGKITGLIQTGSHQVFAQGITSSTVFRQLRAAPRAAHDLSYGSSVELSFNPAGPRFSNGEINPFHVPAIREAFNKLVDRRHIAEEIYGGLAVPRFLALNTAFPDYARLADVARELELRYQHDPEGAERIISREMERLGARRERGRWTHDGRVLRVVLLIRTEDERRQVGDYVGNLLEDIGFQVERRYRTAEEASRIWIASDPAAGQWHIYTGGWVSTRIERDLAANFSAFYTPRGRPEPLWQAYTPTEEFDDIADRLQRRDYQSWDERQQMMADALRLSMEDSVRIWLVDQLNIWPRSTDVQLAVDLAGGMSGSALWPYTIRYRDRVGGSMLFGAPSVLTEPWNPVAGSNWIFDNMITNALQDRTVMPDPFTGLHLPQRLSGALVSVQEDIPVSRSRSWLDLEMLREIEVSDSAWIDWDAEEQRFITVGERHPDGLTARTRIRLEYEDDYLERRWHDGSRVSLADIVLPWILNFDRAKEESRLFDVAHVPTFEVFQRHFKGWEIVSRDPLIIDIYSDQIYPDAETIIAARVPAALPWHTLALGILAERGEELAFSSNKADRLRVDWMSFAAGPSIPILDRRLQTARNDAYIPYADALQPFLRDNEPEVRYAALADWREQRGHFYVGDGPLYLHAVYPVERTVVLRRFEDFPDPSTKWLDLTQPEIPELELAGPLLLRAGQEAEFTLGITFLGEPYPEEDVAGVQYLLFDGENIPAARGEAEATGPGTWTIRLSSDQVSGLGSGANSLEVAVTSHRVALPAFVSHVFATIPGPAEQAGLEP
ncbi:peptide/nickel transport system substrate-binding protein [Natronocella acetinitrilica]|uniref:Peptide/nickel transport system substrate-binding protein n=1 Tax=Natronocella acetinitrilica TaxID=414046 RepID=A0AAE3KHL7_9GAMM|nr:ABC transporter substrate-binding protein [Natronocella acetinitrilica]MCP1676477.1 peptide/nickel transport system substrate-binding protein [Natronocella acetinitrilica]